MDSCQRKNLNSANDSRKRIRQWNEKGHVIVTDDNGETKTLSKKDSINFIDTVKASEKDKDIVKNEK